MLDLDTLNKMLDEAADNIPKEIYDRLNGGVVLSPDIKMHPESKNNDLYIMGEYHRDSMMGRYIVIYGGSFQQLYGGAPLDRVRRELDKTLKHELTHHVESLAGERDLEVEDEINLAQYRNRKGLLP